MRRKFKRKSGESLAREGIRASRETDMDKQELITLLKTVASKENSDKSLVRNTIRFGTGGIIAAGITEYGLYLHTGYFPRDIAATLIVGGAVAGSLAPILNHLIRTVYSEKKNTTLLKNLFRNLPQERWYEFPQLRDITEDLPAYLRFQDKEGRTETGNYIDRDIILRRFLDK